MSYYYKGVMLKSKWNPTLYQITNTIGKRTLMVREIGKEEEVKAFISNDGLIKSKFDDMKLWDYKT